MESATLSASRYLPRPQADEVLVRPTKRFAVAHGKTKAFDGVRGRTVFRCESGRVWLTQAGDNRDTVLERGQRFTCDKTGRVVVEGLADSVVAIAL
ncbi:MAG: DUF2917 domain-containing protein [Tepidisphaeraceae bacterium]